ncbi:hypothetical protein [Nannocystis sp.]|uniref:hypothetical protein n=1 Tax=Nannocystis sp. TaxID=1962667 RepID=UPI0024250423|nr:hypothetical protein [Nannocystis sp.]MBK7830704.1 hypothetical protein [Nannocystis sp.]MBK9756235.1 hypothetical protein [Nannocystis sp.]
MVPAASPLLAAALLLGAGAVIGVVSLERDQLRRVLLGLIDPRPLALLRICFGLCLLLGALEVAPLNQYLFSDEGLLPSPAVPQVYGKAALLGYGDGVRAPAGFVDGLGVRDFLVSGRWSLLYFRDDPAFVRAYFAAFVAACGLFVLGWRTRVAAAITWLLYIGMLRRGDAHWGGEQVYCGFMFLLVLARCGEAFSVDNWLRCRRLRARALLSEADGPGAGAGAPPGPGHPQGLAAIYRRVPAWPQALIVAQLAICYAANGWAKWGAGWVSGDALMYTLQLDKWGRADWHPLVVALGPWPFRIATWGVLWWERLFPLLLIGLWLQASARHPGAPPASRRATFACWLALALALAIAALSGDLVEGPGDPSAPARALVLALMAGAIVATTLVGRRFDRRWLLRWPLAPRVWLGFGAVFHALNLALLNVGAFALATLSVYLACGAGPGAVRGLQRIARALAGRGIPVPKHMSLATPIAAEDRDLPQLRRDAAAVPGWALAGAGALLLAAALLAVAGPERGPWWWHSGWLLVAAGLSIVGWRSARRAALQASGEPWAYGPAGRLAAGGVFTYHLVALLLWQLPRWPALPYRDPVRALVSPWMDLCATRQAWSMFAPNHPRHNTTLRTRVIDAAGVEHDLRTELQHHLVRPSLRHDRSRKIDDAISLSRPELAPWHARWLCRRWELEHREPARAVILERMSAAIDPLAPGPVDFWARAVAQPITRITCATEPFAQLDDELRARHGLPPAPPGSLHYTWPKGQDAPTPQWLLLALGLALGLGVWAREDRRRHVASAVALRGPPG